MGRVDPNLATQLRNDRSPGKAVGVDLECLIEGDLTLGEGVVGEAVVDLQRREQGDAVVTMLGVVPGEEGPAEGAPVFEAAEATWEVRTVL